jgi:hypothetical protein
MQPGKDIASRGGLAAPKPASSITFGREWDDQKAEWPDF